MPQGERFQALLVEDDPLVARAIERCLRARGAEVTIALTCAAARALERNFDTAVLDIDLPDGDGIEVAGHLLASGRTPAVVFFSGHDSPAVVHRAEELGIFVHKSLGTDALFDALRGTVLRAAGMDVTVGASPLTSSGARRKVPR
jgi:two-component system, NarL family, response regulator DesR